MVIGVYAVSLGLWAAMEGLLFNNNNGLHDCTSFSVIEAAFSVFIYKLYALIQ